MGSRVAWTDPKHSMGLELVTVHFMELHLWNYMGLE